MKLFVAAPPNILKTSHIEAALKQSGVSVSELFLPDAPTGTTDMWLQEWARTHSVPVREFKEVGQALSMLARSKDSAVVAVLSPDHPDTLDFVSQAESMRIPVYVYRELYRRDPRVNCRFSPVERPDVWLRALNAEQRDFFRRLHALCQQYDVELTNSTSGDGASLVRFADGTEFESVQLDANTCRVRPRGSFRYRKIPLD